MNPYEIEIQQLKTQICELQEQLQKYTAPRDPTRNKKNYQNHKEELKQKARECKEKLILCV